jgi:hypothetical protein
MARGPKNGSAGWTKRMHVHRHNGFSGCARMMQMQLQNIATADSTTGTTKQIATEMLKYVELLQQSLKTRIDP